MFKKDYTKKDNLYKFKVNDFTTKSVTSFYDEAPFPNYKDHQDKQSINTIGKKNFFLKQIKNFLGFNKKFIEIGSGTSQVSNYLAFGTNNKIFAFDPTLKSLELGKSFSDKNGIKNINYLNADINEDIFSNEVFDLVLCSGVLHHTKDAYESFSKIPKIIKKDGYVIIGLYNSYGRIRTKVRKFFYKFFGKNFVMFLDPVLRILNKDNIKNSEKIKSWIRDQYEHPVETTHTLDEVFEWFDKYDLEFINPIPSSDCSIGIPNNIFVKSKKNTFTERIFQQLRMNFNNLGNEGGLFIVVGKKK